MSWYVSVGEAICIDTGTGYRGYDILNQGHRNHRSIQTELRQQIAERKINWEWFLGIWKLQFVCGKISITGPGWISAGLIDCSYLSSEENLHSFYFQRILRSGLLLRNKPNYVWLEVHYSISFSFKWSDEGALVINPHHWCLKEILLLDLYYDEASKPHKFCWYHWVHS